MKKIFLAVLFLMVVAVIGYGIYAGNKKVAVKKEKIIINEALRTLLYLPLYHAKEAGMFEKNGVDVEIVTGGTATNSFAAMMSGEAQFSQADPMYVPIANEKKGNTSVVAQIVSRIAVWGLTTDTSALTMSAETLKGQTISTHVKPMTAYTYTVKTIRDLGLEPDQDVTVLQNQPGVEITPLLKGTARFAMTLEPNVSLATSRGAKVILSYPKILGDQIFTGLMAKNEYINSHKDVVKAILLSYQQSLDDIYTDKNSAINTAVKYFPQLNQNVIRESLNRMLEDLVIPRSILVTEESWNKAINVRVKSGDLKSASSRRENVSVALIEEVLNQIKK